MNHFVVFKPVCDASVQCLETNVGCLLASELPVGYMQDFPGRESCVHGSGGYAAWRLS